ncbi:MAG: hypothetical protein WCH46_05070 [bacterium]
MNRYIRSLFYVATLFFVTTVSKAQPNIAKDTTHYNDEELYTDDLAVTPQYSWIGGGLIIGLHLPSLTDFNKLIAQPFIHQDLKSQSLFIGGQGFLPFPFLKNLRIGGVGMSGSSSVCCVPDTITTGPFAGQVTMRSLTYKVGYGGLSFDYSILNKERFHLLVGSEFGLGSVEITAQQAVDRNTFNIASEFDYQSFGALNLTHTYHANMFLIKPQVEFEYAPLKWMMLRLAAGYQITAMASWKVDDGVLIKDSGALANVNGNGAFFHLGIFVGFF